MFAGEGEGHAAGFEDPPVRVGSEQIAASHQDFAAEPKNSPFGFIIGSLAFAFGFGIVWHMWWMAILGVIGVIVCLVVRSMDEEPEYVVTAKEIAKIESGRKEYA